MVKSAASPVRANRVSVYWYDTNVISTSVYRRRAVHPASARTMRDAGLASDVAVPRPLWRLPHATQSLQSVSACSSTVRKASSCEMSGRARRNVTAGGRDLLLIPNSSCLHARPSTRSPPKASITRPPVKPLLSTQTKKPQAVGYTGCGGRLATVPAISLVA
jgi:hypothetical protein